MYVCLNILFRNAIVVKISTISTTSTSAGILSWYKNVFRSFFIWMELSSVCATVNILNLQFFQVLCCFNKKGMSIRMPPSCTIHQISIVPDSYYIITYVYSITDLLTVGRSKPLLKKISNFRFYLCRRVWERSYAFGYN